MPAEGFFLAIGGLGVSLAGFAALIGALDRRDPDRGAIFGWRIRNIVISGFSVTFAGIGVPAVFTVTGDVGLTVRLLTLVLVTLRVVHVWQEFRPGPAWPDDRQRRFFTAAEALGIAVTLGNVVVGSVGYLQLMLLMALLTPVGIFLNAIRQITTSDGS
jgi:hypothetical protein